MQSTIADPSLQARHSSKWREFACLIIVAGSGFTASAQTDPVVDACGPMKIEGQTGPYDYRIDLAMLRNPSLAIQTRRTDRQILADVEKHHFPFTTEQLIRPVFSDFGSDLSYLFRVYPNHHRGLITLLRLAEREKSENIKGLQYPVECYFIRAIRFANDDLTVKMAYAKYLIWRDRTKDAEAQLDLTVKMAEDNQITLHIAGLLYAEAKLFDKAVDIARKIYADGFPREELRRALVQAGKFPTEIPSEAKGVTQKSESP